MFRKRPTVESALSMFHKAIKDLEEVEAHNNSLSATHHEAANSYRDLALAHSKEADKALKLSVKLREVIS